MNVFREHDLDKRHLTPTVEAKGDVVRISKSAHTWITSSEQRLRMAHQGGGGICLQGSYQVLSCSVLKRLIHFV